MTGGESNVGKLEVSRRILGIVNHHDTGLLLLLLGPRLHLGEGEVVEHVVTLPQLVAKLVSETRESQVSQVVTSWSPSHPSISSRMF